MQQKKSIVIALLLLMVIMQGYSQTIHLKTKELESISNLGIVHSEYDTISLGLYEEYYDIFKNEFTDGFSSAGIKNVMYIPEVLSFENIDKDEITKFCTDHGIDALLISKIYFLRTSFIYKSFLNLDDIEKPSMITGKPDIYFELKIFDQKGNNIIWTTHKVQTGNSSMVSPQWTINKGLKKTIKKLKK